MEIEHDGPTDSTAGDLVRANEVLPGVIVILPQDMRPFFPGQAVPLILDAEKWEPTIKAAVDHGNGILGLMLVRDENDTRRDPGNLHHIGTACRIHRVQQTDGKLQVLMEGLQRFQIKDWVSTERPLRARVDYRPEPVFRENTEIKAYAVAVLNVIKELLPLNPLYREELKMFVEHFHPNEPSNLADFAAALTTSGKQELQAVLATFELLPRLEKVLLLVRKELELARAQTAIREQVEQEIESRQREAFLREQLKVIQKELGISKDDRTAETDKFEARLAEREVPPAVLERIEEEMQKFGMLETGSPEYSVTRNYLDWLTLLPWGRYSDDALDLKLAREQLDADHDGLEDIKDRILEFLAVGIMKGSVSGSILLFVGPPGVGKTSLGRSIATTLQRKFYRFSLGGMRDEAEIKGHRRTYIGAMPGKFVQAIKEAGSANPVIMLDEIDKIGASFRGDPASALLEVLDPEQNSDFLDHYLDVRFDLSKVLFVCTANQLDTIPGPLLDRMEVIKLSGYLADEKLKIARNHLLPRQIKRAGLKPRGQLRIDTPALKKIIEGYAREAGVRRLEKHLGTIARKAVVKLLHDEPAPIHVRIGDVESYLGKPLFRPEQQMRGAGIITGLAWTAMGGATLSIEASRVHSYSRGLKLTGQLGGVMKESAEIAFSYIMSHADRFEADPQWFEKSFVHLHVPAGATPKDGPSAGITMACALLSLARGKAPKKRLAMTGELTLTGTVLPVGGIREKIIAAKRIGIKTVILPEANSGDFEDLPEHIRAGVTAHFVKDFEEVAPLVFA